MSEQFTEDLNIVKAMPIEIELMDGDLHIIAALGDHPNEENHLTSAQLKAKFDEAGLTIQSYINETLIPAVLAQDATEEARIGAESDRAAAETARASAETDRAAAETARATAETARSSAEADRAAAEAARADAETDRQAAETARSGAESQRAAAETDRIAAESLRASAEQTRLADEQDRSDAEAVRQANEAVRVSNEEERQNFLLTIASAEEARNFFEEFNASRQYVAGNKVSFSGSSYICVSDCTGVYPTDPGNDNWLVMAEKGRDGTGSGDMAKSVYDRNGRNRDIFTYTDEKFSALEKATLFEQATRSVQGYSSLLYGSTVCFDGKVILFPARGNTTGLYSYDMETWSTFTIPVAARPNTGSTAYSFSWRVSDCGSKLVAFEYRKMADAYILSSEDGITWTLVTEINTSSAEFLHQLVYDAVHGTYILTKYDYKTRLYVSEDLENWEAVSTGLSVYAQTDSYMVVDNGTTYLLTLTTQALSIKSTDGGYTWKKLGDGVKPADYRTGKILNTPAGLVYISYTGNNYYHSVYRFNTNGTLTRLSSISVGAKYSHAFYTVFNGKVVGVSGGSHGKLFYSTDCVNWVFVDLPRSASFGITTVGSTLLLLGSNGEVLTSDDAIHWDGGDSILLDTAETDITAAVREALNASKVELVTYIGTGTYGVDAPCSLSGNLPLVAVIALDVAAPNNKMTVTPLTYNYADGVGLNGGSGKMSQDGKTFFWYSNSAANQLNTAGTTYSFLLIE